MKKKMIVAMSIWSVLLLTFLMWSIASEKRKTIELAHKEADTTFNKDQAFRLWATKHGGVYVPATEETHPNPYLSHLPERDLTTPSGRELTLMNPAYMIRQIMGEYDGLYGTKGHIASLNPLNPINESSEWERNALHQFEKGIKEVHKVVSQNEKQFLMLIRPMVTEVGCLKCHGNQGYKEGDIRGGVGVSVPMKPYLALEKQALKRVVILYSLFWIIGIISIVYFTFRSKTLEDLKNKAVDALQASEEEYRTVVEGTDDLVTKVDREGKFTFVNRKGETIFGFSKTELIGMSAFDFLHHEDREITESWFKESIDKHLSQASTENRQVNKKSGKIFHTLWTTNFAYNDEGELMSISGIATDISERKHAEQEREKLILELRDAVNEVKTLRGILPICSYCKNIRNDDGYFEQIESYVHKHSGVDFSHTICKPCMKKHHPEEYESIISKKR